MRTLTLSISFLLLNGCTFTRSIVGKPSFQAGDCIATDSEVKNFHSVPESWETERKELSMELIVKVGNEKYLTVEDPGHGRISQSYSKFSWDSIMQKVECSERLKQVKEELKEK